MRYVATAVGGEDDPEWLARIEAHQRRRPQSWTTEETGADPARLTALLAEAKPDETLLVDDLGGWVAALLDPARQPNDDVADVAALADGGARLRGPGGAGQPRGGPVAGADDAGRAGRSPTRSAPPTRRWPTPATGWSLVVAGQPVWLKTADAEPPHRSPTSGPTPMPAATAGPGGRGRPPTPDAGRAAAASRPRGAERAGAPRRRRRRRAEPVTAAAAAATPTAGRPRSAGADA